ncbi:MAG: hypothetical protein LUF35_12790 [Lachnospiraceae bacterium]|nr:hypothetical protein [Lachnospiraceae bacterium]
MSLIVSILKCICRNVNDSILANFAIEALVFSCYDIVSFSGKDAYCDYVDAMFDYDKPYRQKLCTSPMSADTLKNWAMYEQPTRESKTDQDWEKLLEKAARNSKPEPKVKIGRNDPCLFITLPPSRLPLQ